MNATGRDMGDAVKVLPFEHADMLVGVIVNSIAGIVEATEPLHAFTDAETYRVVTESLPTMLASEGGPELAQVALAAAITRLVRIRRSEG